MPPRRSGLALLVVIGTLGVLAALATAFVTMAQLERRASRQRVHAAKAYLLARSGLEDGLARLARGQDPESLENAYAGENWDGSADGLLSAYEAGQEAYRATGAGTAADTEACPLRHAMRPSFFARALPSANPATQPVEGRLRGYSGALPGDAHTQGNAWTLRAGCEDGFYVNALEGPSDYYNDLAREVQKLVLCTLVSEMDAAQPPAEDGVPIGVSDAVDLVDRRPAGGWNSLAQVRSVLGWDAAKAGTLAPYLAFRGWKDRKVVRSNLRYQSVPGLGLVLSNQYGATDSVGMWASRAPNRDWSGDGISDVVSRLPHPRWGGFQPATSAWVPLRVDWLKRHTALLRALCDETCLKAAWRKRDTSAGDTAFRHDTATTTAGYLDEYRLANALESLGTATSYLAFPNWDGTWRLDSWEEFNRFVDQKLVSSANSGELQRLLSLFKAVFNPNTTINKVNPDLSGYRISDKSDILGGGELCFDNPLKRLDALGRLTDARGRLLAERQLSCSAAFEQFRLTAQSEFCAADGGLGRLDLAGDESRFRFPGEAGFLTANAAGAPITSGAKMGPTLGLQMGLPGTDERGNPYEYGLSLQTWPEPQWPDPFETPPFPGQLPCPRPADWDGSLRLATVDTQYTARYGAEAVAPASSMRFLASWERGFDAEWAGGGPNTATWPACEMLRDRRHGSTGKSVLGYMSSEYLNNLRPDGIYSEQNRTPAFPAPGNVPPRRGCISFWVKPGHSLDPATLAERGEPALFVNLSRMPEETVDTLGRPRSQFFMMLGYRFSGAVGNTFPLSTGPQFSGFLETAANAGDNDTGYEFGNRVRSRVPGSTLSPCHGGAHQWHLMTQQWDFQAPALSQALRVTVDGGRTDPSAAYQGNFLDPMAGSAEDLTGPSIPWWDMDRGVAGGPPGEHRMVLGSTWDSPDPTWPSGDFACVRGIAWCSSVDPWPADATFDEFAVYDLGGGLDAGATLARNRFAEGRYYKEDDGRWTSALIALAPGSRLTGLDWTLILPELDPTDDPLDPKDPNRVFYGTGADLTQGETADALIEIRDASGGLLYASSRPGLRRNRVDIPLPDGRFRISATIRPRLGDNVAPWDKLNAPLLESPVLDDLTVQYLPPGGPRTLGFQEAGD